MLNNMKAITKPHNGPLQKIQKGRLGLELLNLHIYNKGYKLVFSLDQATYFNQQLEALTMIALFL